MNVIPTPTRPTDRARETAFCLIRILLGGIFLSLLTAACLYLDHTAFSFFHTRMSEEESKTIAWFVKEIGFALPWIVICLFHAIVYHRHDRRDGMAQREMFWQVVIVAILTYGVLLPYISSLSRTMYEAAVEAGAKIPQTEAGVPWTLMMKVQEWFIRFSIPLGILAVFHGMRASRERRCPDPRETLLTVGEYEAQQINAAATDETEADHV